MKYEDAGVNISKADFFIEKIKPLAQATLTDLFWKALALRFLGGAKRLQESCFGLWH